MVKRAISVLLCVLLAMLSTPCMAMAQVEQQTAVVDGGNSDRVHLREAPSADAKSLGLYFTGTEVVCTSDPSQAWTNVRIGMQEGYMRSEYLRLGDDAKTVSQKQPTGVAHADSWVNVRSLPSREGEVIGKCYNGDTVTILGETSTNWYYVVTKDVVGYMTAEYVSVDGLAAVANADARTAYVQVLENHAEFVNTSAKRNMYLGQLSSGLEGLAVQLTQFAVVDLDADGSAEVVVRLTVGGSDHGYEVLDERDGAVYGYDVAYRGLMDLKQDGTLSYAEGAANTGFGRLVLTQSGYGIRPIASSQSTEAGDVAYQHNGAAITGADYAQLQDEQDKKPDANWLDFTSENLTLVFGG